MHTVTGDGMKTSKHYRVDRGALCDSEAKDLQQIPMTSMAVNMLKIKGP
jgi:hypothetical protein